MLAIIELCNFMMKLYVFKQLNEFRVRSVYIIASHLIAAAVSMCVRQSAALSTVSRNIM